MYKDTIKATIKNTTVSVFFCIFLATCVFVVSLVLYEFFHQPTLFDKESFIKKGYSQEDILFFSDVAFREANKLRKWTGDIKVEIDTTCPIDAGCIAEVDTIIQILSPLVAPIKIYKVSEGGNLIIHMNVDYTPAKIGIGYALVNRFNIFSESITHADVYTIKYCRSILPHEICHAIGLAHPENKYLFYTTMGKFESCVKEYLVNGKKVKDFSKLGAHVFIFETDDDKVKFEEVQKALRIALAERRIIKMLYSGDFKSGLSRSTFEKEMGLTVTRKR